MRAHQSRIWPNILPLTLARTGAWGRIGRGGQACSNAADYSSSLQSLVAQRLPEPNAVCLHLISRAKLGL